MYLYVYIYVYVHRNLLCSHAYVNYQSDLRSIYSYMKLLAFKYDSCS